MAWGWRPSCLLSEETSVSCFHVWLVRDDQGCLKLAGTEHRSTGPSPAEGFLSPPWRSRPGYLRASGPGVSVHNLHFCQARFGATGNQRHLTA